MAAMRNKRDMIAAVLLILVGIAVIFWSFRLKVGTMLRPLAGFFPLLVGIGIIGLALILFAQAWAGSGGAAKPFGKWRRPAVMLAALALYAVLLEPLGYIIATIFIAAVTVRILGVQSWKVIAVSSVVLSISVYFIFTQLLAVELPAGILPF